MLSLPVGGSQLNSKVAFVMSANSSMVNAQACTPNEVHGYSTAVYHGNTTVALSEHGGLEGQLSTPHTTTQLCTAQSVEGGMDWPRAPDGVPQSSPVDVQSSQLVHNELQVWFSSVAATGGGGGGSSGGEGACGRGLLWEMR